MNIWNFYFRNYYICKYMDCQRLFNIWSQLVDVPLDCIDTATKIRIVDNENGMTADDMRGWIIRKIDRADFKDWMPYRVKTSHSHVCVYYVNINSTSHAHSHTLVLRMEGGILPIFDEYDGSKIINSIPAKIDPAQSQEKLSCEDFEQLSKYITECSGPKKQ